MKTVADQMLYSVKLANTIDESCSSVHDSLETSKLVLWSTGQQTVTVVDPLVRFNIAVDELPVITEITMSANQDIQPSQPNI